MKHSSIAEDLKPLTSLRFVAAMMIVGLHLKASFVWPILAHVPAVAVQGVSFFFVLSGFILTHVYSARPLPGFRSFMTARFARLWPVHVAALLLLLTCVRGDSITFEGPGIFNRWVSLAVNLMLIQSWFPTLLHEFSYNSVSWSISTEMAFYAAFPLLLFGRRKHWLMCVAISILSLAWVLLTATLIHLPAEGNPETVTMSSFTYTTPLSRSVEFVTGMSAYGLWSRFIRQQTIPIWAYTVVEVATVIGAAAWFSRYFWVTLADIGSMGALPYWFGDAGSFWVFAILIIVFAGSKGWLGKLVGLPLFVWLGKISFSVYMFHQILIKIFALSFPQWASPLNYMCALIAVSAASFYLIEEPGRKWLPRFLGVRARPRGTSHGTMLEVENAVVGRP